ncbi:hypothetical protein ACIBKX_40425 [Streptomyces sp. NPDC050658]|uniref:hypothetical protein n=1 Tax=unclassified Streptomyces TaxID=2593676 RepID=UPI00344A8D25
MENAQRYALGQRDTIGHYPVTVDGTPAGYIYRRHGNWFPVMPGRRIERRFTDRHQAADHLAELVDQGHRPTIPAPGLAPLAPHHEMRRTADGLRAARTYAHRIPDLRPTLANLVRAAEAMARLDQLGWIPLEGYPGADQPWHLECRLCGWQGHRFWSKLRGRNGDGIPRPANRHPGCIPTADHTRKIAILTADRLSECRCDFRHPMNIPESLDVLRSIDLALIAYGDMVTAVLYMRGILDPCPAATRRARFLRAALDNWHNQNRNPNFSRTPFADIPVNDCLLDHGYSDCTCDSCDQERAAKLEDDSSTTYQISTHQGRTVEVVQGQRAAEEHIRTVMHESYSVEKI